ncbi:MAG: hypothetical protein ACPHSE_03360 [Flavobacteriaceae bacterium]
MRKYLFILGLICFQIYGQTTRFFVSAHQDDWQLFMNPNVYHSIKTPGDKTVIVHTTAGDAGEGLGNDAYYKAREEGSLRAIRFLCNTNTSGAGYGTEMQRKHLSINGKKIVRYAYKNAVVYFLRLPDGNSKGQGYKRHDYKSLNKLFKEEVNNIHTIDHSAIYKDKQDLMRTLAHLVQTERLTGSIEFHLPDTDQTINPNDHSDHQNSSKLFQVVGRQLGGLTFYFYVNYFSAQKPLNSTPEELLIAAGTWGATTSGIGDLRHYSTWDRLHNVWLGRQYFRTEKIKSNPKE